MTSPLLATLREVLMDAVHVIFDFFKVVILISIAMKLLAELDWVRYLSPPLEPVMQLIGAHIGRNFFLRLSLAFVTCAVINILYLRFRGDAREPETAPNEVS